MSTKRSAGLLLYRLRAGGIEVFLVHPGGPFWHRKDKGVWSIPKGEHTREEEPLAAARREFHEETGVPVGPGSPEPLGAVRLPSGKTIAGWALQGDLDAAAVRSNTFELEWPSKSGKIHQFPEVDRAGWFTIDEARQKMHPAQTAFLDRLLEVLKPA